MKVLCIYDKSAPKYHRILIPVFLMADVEIVVDYRITEENAQDVDIVFFNRLIPATTIDHINELRIKYGFKLIIDFDDHWRLDRDHLLYPMYKMHRVTEIMEAFIQEADAVTVTHERLQAEAIRLNSNVHILPNAIPHFDQFTVSKIPDPDIRLFWAGGITHRNDLKIIERPLQLTSRIGIKRIICGYEKNNPEWKEMAKMFTGNSSFNTRVISSVPCNEYYKSYSLCDISLIPLQETRFNSFKSNLKILEAANISAPVIVSKVHPYLGFPEDVVNYVSGNQTWFSQINKLINDRELIIEQGKRLKEYCDIHFNYSAINEKRKKLFYETIQSGKAGIFAESIGEPMRNE